MEYLLLLIGFALLIKGADYFVDGAASVAYRLHVSTTIVGLTIVALGTSLPEAAVSISASMQGSNALAISNVLGSNIFNILVVVGCSALITPFLIPKEVIHRDIGFNIFCSFLLLACLFFMKLTRWEGILFLAILVGYLVYLVRDARRNPVEEEEQKILPMWKCWVFIILGAAAIMIGGQVTVNAAKTIAASLGMTETLIGLTVVSVGTSLPELVTSVVAARKNQSGLSIGNAIGSSILNILFILGMSSAIHPLVSDLFSLYDCLFLCAVSVGIFIYAKMQPKMTRTAGGVMIAVYVCYLVYIIMR